jgi:hypothetical protein
MFMTALVFEARHCPTLQTEIKKTKLQIYTSPQAGIKILCLLHYYNYQINNDRSLGCNNMLWLSHHNHRYRLA